MKQRKIFLGAALLITGILLGYTAALNIEIKDKARTMNYGSSSHAEMNHEMSALSMVSGDEFDKEFIKEMIAHHAGAVEMAEEVLRKSHRVELVQLAKDIISSQSKEIEMMKKWQEEWFSK